jgi:hypothetical protein
MNIPTQSIGLESDHHDWRVINTSGNWIDEETSANHFDYLVTSTNLFRIYKEISGFYIQPRIGQDFTSPRIDRLLIPTDKLSNAGWKEGIIGVELKRSGIKAGPVLSQMIDYSRAIWKLKSCGGIRVWLNWVFLWPLAKTTNTWASLMAQNRFGSCDSAPWAKLLFHSGEQLILRVNNDDSIVLGNPKNGNRAGSR